jgi:hypothetical protein
MYFYAVPPQSISIALALSLLRRSASPAPKLCSVSASFPETRADGIFEEPPDALGARRLFVTFVNNGFVIYNKDGSLVSRAAKRRSGPALWAPIPNLSDPRIL